MITLSIILYLIVSISISVDQKSLVGFAVVPALLLIFLSLMSVVLGIFCLIYYIVVNFP